MTNTKTNIGANLVTSHKIIGTSVRVFTAYEPYNDHSTSFHVDGVRWGKVGTARLPEHLAKLPAMSDERYIAVKAWFAGQYRRAYDLIVTAHPEARDGRPDMGNIEVTGA